MNKNKPKTLLQHVLSGVMRWNTRIIIEFDRVKEFAETICEKNHIRRVNYRPEGYLSEVLSREQILSVVREIIKTEDQTSTLQRAFYWAGILDDESSVPLIKNAIEKNRCDSSDLRVAQRALIMLKIAPEQLYKLVESSIGDDDLLKIELYWYFCYYAGQSGEFPEQFSADAIVKDVTASVDTEYWPVLTDQLNFLQGQGANAAPLFDALVSENPGRSVYYPHFALWLEKAANLQSLSAIFAKPEEYEAFIRYLIYRSFLEPEKYSFLIPVVTSSAQALLKAELQSSTMWAVTLYIHANLPGEMINVEEYRKADDWTQRLAAYLILLGTDPSIDLQEAYLQEEDSDVKIIIQLCIWLQNPEEFSGELDRFVRSQLPELEYGLPEVLSTRFATLPAVKDNPVLKAEIMFLSITDNSSVTTLEEAGPLYIRRLLKNNLIDGTDFSGSENRKSFFFSQMLYKINISFHAHELEQMIVHATDSSEAEIIFRLVNFHEIPITASSALILEKFIYSENPVILPDELPELLPFLFNDGRSAVYQSNMVTAILPYLQTDPLLAARVYDHVLMDTDVHIEVLKTLRPLPGNSRVTFLSRIVAGETVGWKELLDISYSKLNGSYEDIPGMPEALIRCLKSEDVPSDIALFFLDKLFALNDASYFAESMELLRQHGGEASVRSYILRFALSESWTMRRAVARYLAEHPEAGTVSLAFRLLADDDSDVADEAVVAIVAFLEQKEVRTCSKHIPGSSDDTESAYEFYREKADDETIKEVHIGRQVIITLLSPENFEGLTECNISEEELMNIRPFLAVDFIDDKEKRIVVHVCEEENFEAINWLLEQGTHHFYNIQWA